MLNFQVLTYKSKAKLQKDLANFGLNPIDWEIHREKGAHYKIQNKHEKSFTFKGRAEKACKWQSLSLLSL